MQTVAQAWLVYRLTQSSFMLGVVAFCNLAPVLLFTLFGGIIADRASRHRLLIVMQSIALVQSLVLALLTLGGWITPVHIVVLALVLGMVHAFEMPARHSFLAEMVPKADLSNAIALNSSAFNLARFLGPSLAGILVVWVGEGMVFLINTFSFLAVLMALLAMRTEQRSVASLSGSTLKHLYEGLHYAWHSMHIRVGLFMVALVSFVSASITTLMPVFAGTVYAGNARTLGWLLSAIGIGALIGALKLAQRKSISGIDRVIGMASMIAGFAVIVFALTPHFWLALTLMVIAGYAQTTAAAATNTLIQVLLPDKLRGRVMSLFSMVFIGFMPLGSLMAGSLAQVIGVEYTVAIFGMCCFSGALLFLFYAPKTEALD